jgi:hypothetical protein
MDAEGDDDDASPITQEGWPSTIRGASESPMQVTPQQQDNLMRGPKPSTYYWICVGGSVAVYMAIANSIV